MGPNYSLDGSKDFTLKVNYQEQETAVAKFEIWRDKGNGTIRFHGEVTQHDMQHLQLDHIEAQVILSTIDSVSDQLQNLELIFRRLEQQGGTK